MHRSNVRRACIAVVATAAALGTVAACGDGGNGSNGLSMSPHPTKSAAQKAQQNAPESGSVSLAALQRVEDRTQQAQSAKVTGDMELGATSTTMDGALDWSNHITGNLTLQQKGGALAQLGGDGKMLARYTSDSMYVNMGPQIAQQAGGKHWIKYNYDDLASYAGASGDVLKDQLQHNSPTQSVRMLLTSGDVKKVGTETVGTEQTTHYSGTIDVADFTAKSSTDLTQDQLKQFRDQLQQNGVTTEKIDIWVNGKDLLVKKIEDADSSQGHLKSTAFYTDYGTPVDVEVPDSSDTTDFMDLLNSSQ